MGEFLVSTDSSLLDLDLIHAFLSTCYWSPGIHRSRVERAIANSLNFGGYIVGASRPDGRPAQAGFARVVTDKASFAYLCDVFVLEAYRGRGLSKRLMEAIVAHPDLRGLRRFCLLTRDAQGLYTRYGFAPLPDHGRYLERIDRESHRLP